MADKITTPLFRLSFAQLFTPKADQSGNLKYSLNMLFPKTTDLTLLKEAAKAAVVAKWGPNPPKGLKNPFRDGDEKDYDGYAGHIFVTASSKNKPGLVDQNVQPIMDQALLYSGCYCYASINAYAYEGKDAKGAILNRGVAFGLMNVQLVKAGEPFGARSNPTDDFAAVAMENAQAKSTVATPAAGDDFFQ